MQIHTHEEMQLCLHYQRYYQQGLETKAHKITKLALSKLPGRQD